MLEEVIATEAAAKAVRQRPGALLIEILILVATAFTVVAFLAWGWLEAAL